MSETIVTSIADGDWGLGTIWDTGTVPDSGSDDVSILNFVTVGTAESFAAGTVSVTDNGLLEVDGSLDVTGALADEGSGTDFLVSGSLGVGGLLTVGALQVNGAGFSVNAATILVTDQIAGNGTGTVASTGTLTNDGSIFSRMQDTLTLAPAVFLQQGTTAVLEAFGSNSLLVLAPTAGFANMSGGTLNGGTYEAQTGTLELPDVVSAIVGADFILADGGQIDGGGETIAASLNLIGSAASLILGDADFATINTITVDGGVLLVDTGTLDAPAVVVGADGTLSGPGTVTGNIDNAGTLSDDGTLAVAGTISGSGDVQVQFQSSLTAPAITLDGGSLLDQGSIAVSGTIAVNGGLISLGGTLTAGTLVLAGASSELQGNFDATVSGSIENDGLIQVVGDGGILHVLGPVSGSGSMEIQAFGSLELGQASDQIVTFDPAGGILQLDQPGSFTGTIEGFSLAVQLASVTADAIDLPGFAPGTLTDSYSGTSAGGTLTIESGGSVVAALALAGDYLGSTFTLIPDGSTGTFIELAQPTIFTSESGGDWSTATIWNLGTVPNSAADYVLVRNALSAAGTVGIGAGESFTVGTAEIGLGQSTLDIAGTLTAAQLLAVDTRGQVELQGGVVAAGNVADAGRIAGSGTLDAAGTIADGGFIGADQAGQTLSVAPAVYQGVGELEAGAAGAALLLAPSTGAAGFASDADGTLTAGNFAATTGGTLILPAAITDLSNAALVLEGAGSSIQAGGTAVEEELSGIGTGQLQVAGYDFVAANTLTVADGGTIQLGGESQQGFLETDLPAGTLEAPQLVLAAGTSGLPGGLLDGYGTVTGDISNSGQILSTVPAFGEHLLDLTGSVTGPGTLLIGDASSLELGQANAEPVTFQSVGFVTLDALVLDRPDSYSGTIFGFTGDVTGGTISTDAVDLVGEAPGTLSAVYNGDTVGGALTISAGGTVVSTLDFSGDYTQSSFVLEPDGADGTDVAFAVPCFAAGTRLLTARGEVAVEAVRIGDAVPTGSGALRRVQWVGRRRIDLDRHARAACAAPVVIEPHAFGPGAPRRTLLLSPDHAVLVDNALIPIRLLVNGASIARAPARGAVEYFHVELDRHDVLFAEGLATESYLDTGNRGQFANSGGVRVLHPDLAALAWDERACASLLLGGERVIAAHARLLERALALGHGLTQDAGLSALADGVVVPVQGSLTGLRMTLPAGTREVLVRSRRSVPRDLDASSNDERTLGVAVAGVWHAGRALALQGAAFASGFHALERAPGARWRWTEGEARLVLARRRQTAVLELRLLPIACRYWLRPAAPPLLSMAS